MDKHTFMLPKIPSPPYSKQDADPNDIVKRYLKQIYEALVSADRKSWRKIPPVDVQFMPSPDEPKEVWLETRPKHVSQVARVKQVLKSER